MKWKALNCRVCRNCKKCPPPTDCDRWNHMCWSVRLLCGHLFSNLPVYERGEQTETDLYKAYTDTFECTLGFPTFKYLIKLLTKGDRTKYGQSSYFIRFRYMGQLFKEMLDKLSQMESIASCNISLELKTKTKSLKNKLKAMYFFLSYDYSLNHLEFNSNDKMHCCTYAVGGNCNHEHADNICHKCNDCFTFFSKEALFLFNECLQVNRTNSDAYIEIKSMILSLDYIQEVFRWYMADQLWAKVQFNAIAKIKDQLKIDPKSVLIVTDHKQKVLLMKFFEGQVEYFGKKGMSLLGFMILSHYEGDKNIVGDEGRILLAMKADFSSILLMLWLSDILDKTMCRLQ